MNRPTDRQDDSAISEIARARGLVVENAEAPHPAIGQLMRRDRRDGDERRTREFLRIDRGHEA